MSEKKECEWCGNTIYGKTVWHGLYHFCSNKCLNEWAKANPHEAKTAKKKGCLTLILVIAAVLIYAIFFKK